MISSFTDGEPPNPERHPQNLLESSLELSNALTQADSMPQHSIFRSASNDLLNGTTIHEPKRPRITRESVFRFGRSRQQPDIAPPSPSPPPAPEEKLAEVRSLLDELRLQLMASQSDKAMLESTFAAERAELLRTIHEKVEEKTEAESRAVYHFQQVEQLKKSNKELQSELDSYKGTRDEERIQLTREHTEMKQELRTLKREYESARQDWELKASEYTRESDQAKATIDALTLQTQQSSELLKLRLEEATVTMTRLAACEAELKKYQALDLNPEHIKQVEEELHSHVANAHRLEKENGMLNRDLRHYKAIYQNVEKLREEKYSLEHQLRSMAVFKDKSVQLEVENAVLKRERAEWATFLENEDNLNLTTPYAICRELARLRNDQSSAAKLEKDISELSTSQETVILEAEKRIAELGQQIREKENLRQVEQANANILVKDKQLLQKEISILREQLKSYDIEEITYMSERYDSAKTQRLNELEGLLGQYRVEIEALRTMMTAERTRALQNRSGQPVDSTPPILQLPTGQQLQANLMEMASAKVDLSKDLSTLNAELQLKTKELEVVQRQIDILKQGLISGGVSEDIIRSVAEVRSTAPAMDAEDSLMIDSQAPKQRILQLKDNPASREQAIRQSMLDDLRKENKELITRLQHGQDGSAMDDLEPSTIIPEQSFVNLLAENERMANTVAQKEKRILRMQQVWVAKVREYHEAVASLLGYKVDFSADGMVRLASMYADPNDISFVFKSSENDQGTLKIVGANKDMYMKTLESSYNYCVLERGSIPAFLSAVTMELIDYQPHGDDRDHEMIEEDEHEEEEDRSLVEESNYYEIDEDSEDNVYEEEQADELEHEQEDVEQEEADEDEEEPLEEYSDIEEPLDDVEEEHDHSEFTHYDDEEGHEEEDNDDDEDEEGGLIPQQEEPTHYIIDDDDDE